MERIDNFKSFSKDAASKAELKVSEENEVKRNEITDNIKAVLVEMEITSLSDLTEEQKTDFVNTLFSTKTTEETK
jgi:hypothetical protein